MTEYATAIQLNNHQSQVTAPLSTNVPPEAVVLQPPCTNTVADVPEVSEAESLQASTEVKETPQPRRNPSRNIDDRQNVWTWESVVY